MPGFLNVVQNYVGFSHLDTLPTRFALAFDATLRIRMSEVADKIVDDAKQQLQPGHGVDTGKLKESLTKKLIEVAAGAMYKIYSDEAAYWSFVEIGHMLRNGEWWEGYHYIHNAIEMNRGLLKSKAQQAFHEAAVITRASSGLHL